jgi:uncharacterized protein with beta-barrel porin domain
MADCVPNGTELDCSGDLSAGVTAGPPFDTLVVSGVTADITPTSGLSGIVFQVNGPITINVDTGDHGVSVTGVGADGLVAQSYDGSNLGITYSGDIQSAAGRGIYATGLGDISETSTGDVSSGLDAIHVESYEAGGGTVTIDHTGNLTSGSGSGVYATTQGDVGATVNGNIESDSDAVHLQSFSTGTVTIGVTGDVTSHNGDGIFASTQGSISETSAGTISASGDGIHLQGYDVGNVTLGHTGDITSSAGNGVWVDTQGDVTATVTGNVEGALNAIHARSSGTDAKVTLTHSGGTLTAHDGDGIEAIAPNGTVDVTNSGDISASGDGINAQNFSNGNVSVSQTGHTTAQRGIVAKSSSGAVIVSSTGDIDATGAGVDASSTGAGVEVTQTGYVNSATDEGISLNSSGGSLTLKGSGAVTADSTAIALTTSAPGATISMEHSGDVTSTERFGIYASASQGGVSIDQTGLVNADHDAIFAKTTGFGTVEVTATGALTSTGGSGINAFSSGGAVSVTQTGLITAQGDGIAAQTTGGGSVVVVEATGGIDAGGRGIAANSSSGGIYVTHTGDITAGGRGIEATSNGTGTDVKIWQTGNVGSSGAEGIYASAANGAVGVNVWGNVSGLGNGITATNNGGANAVVVNAHGSVTSDDGYGIYALAPNGSIDILATGAVTSHAGGSDTAAIFAANDSADAPVTITAQGNVTSDNGTAILAASTSSDVSVFTSGNVSGGKTGIQLSGKGGALDIEVDGGSVVGSDAAINFVGQGGTSNLVNHGVISNANGINGLAITASQTETSVQNFGTISGNVSLSPWTNAFLNGEGGTFNMGNSINLGNLGNTLTNDGTVSVGGIGNVATTTLNGAFLNRENGLIVDDLDLANGVGDNLHVNGEANLDGTVKLNLVSFSGTPQSVEFLTADQWINTRAIDTSANPTIVAHVSYSSDNKTAYVTVDGFDFAPEGVGGTAGDIGTYLNTVVLTDPNLAPIGLALANLSTVDEVNDALDQLDPSIYQKDQQSTNVDNIGFVNRLFSCKEAEAPNPFNAEGECNWVRADYGAFERRDSGDGGGFTAHAFNVSGGHQMSLGGDWRLDVGAGVVSSGLDANDASTSSGLTGQVGAALKFVPGQALLAASATGSFGHFDNTRPIAFPGFSDTLKGTSDLATLNGRLRAAYTFQSGDYYARPQIDLDAVYVHAGAVDETGTVAAMHVDASNQITLSASPTLEVGGQTILDDDSILRPFVSGGATVYANTTSTMTGHFTTDTSGNSFTVSSASDPVVWNFSAGFDLLRAEGQTLRGYYSASVGATTTAQSGGLKLSAGF